MATKKILQNSNLVLGSVFLDPGYISSYSEFEVEDMYIYIYTFTGKHVHFGIVDVFSFGDVYRIYIYINIVQ